MSSRRARLVAAAALALVIGVPASLGATGLAAKVVGMSDSTPTAAEYPASKVTICHHTHSKTNPFVTITVSQNALPAHMAHGDTVGACTPTAAPVAAATSHKLKKAHKAKHSAGKSSLHGQHGKSAAAKAATHGKSGEAHGQSGAATTASTTVHGKSGQVHGQGAAHQTTHGKGQANGKSQTTHGKTGQVHGNGQAHGKGQGNGQGQGQGGTHGNGGGNGKGH